MNQTKFTDSDYLLNQQYRDSRNLETRLDLHQQNSTNPQGWFPWLWDVLLELPANAKVLELGSGSGAMWMACPERIPAGWAITISDFSPGMLDSAWRKLITLGRAFKYQEIDAQAIPYPDATFDIVIANYMLYHVPDRAQALAEIRRVLRPGGVLTAATASKDSMKEIRAWFHAINPGADASMGHSLFTLENGQSQLEPFFNDVEIRHYPNQLRITDVKPLMSYIRSTTAFGGQPEAVFARLEQNLLALLETDGEIYITKDSGLFLARNV